MEFNATVIDTQFDYCNRQNLLILAFENQGQHIDYMNAKKGEMLTFKCDSIRKLRTTDANAYLWALTHKLANALTSMGAPTDVLQLHAETLYKYGQPELDENGNAVIISVRKGIKVNEFYQYAHMIGESDLSGKTFEHWKIYRPSHTYNSKEFSLLLDGVVSDCKDVGVETKTPQELAMLYKEMERNEKHNTKR